jgi:hypothetical protein
MLLGSYLFRSLLLGTFLGLRILLGILHLLVLLLSTERNPSKEKEKKARS